MSLYELNKILEYTEDPEIDLEVKANKEWNDKYIKDIDKQYRKYIDIMYHILKNNEVEFDFNENKNLYKVYFVNKIDYNTFMAKEKKSKRFNSCLKLELNDIPFEELSKDYITDRRYMNIWVKDGI